MLTAPRGGLVTVTATALHVVGSGRVVGVQACRRISSFLVIQKGFYRLSHLHFFMNLSQSGFFFFFFFLSLSFPTHDPPLFYAASYVEIEEILLPGADSHFGLCGFRFRSGGIRTEVTGKSCLHLRNVASCVSSAHNNLLCLRSTIS